jgi:hypothetical protein
MSVKMSRILPLAVAAALVVAACGSDEPDGADAPVPTVSDADDGGDDGGDDSGLRAPTPIEIARGSGGANTSVAAEAASADAAPGGAVTSDMMIAPVPWVTEFVVGDGMPPLPTNQIGYVFDSAVTVSVKQVEQLASALGVDGAVTRIDEGYGVSYRVGPDDGSAPSVWVFEDAQLSWNYNSPWNEDIVRSTCAVSIDSEGNESTDCDEPEPPVGVPSESEAERRARDLLVALGANLDGLVFETWADDWFASVSASRRLDIGGDVQFWNFGFGAEGVLQHASGNLASPDQVGPYPLVDLDTAVARLGDSWFGGSGGIATDIAVTAVGAPAGEPAIAVDPPAEATASGGATDSGVAADTPADEPAVAVDPPADATTSDAPAIEPAIEPDVEPGVEGDVEGDVEILPTEPMPVEPESVTVTLVDVQPDLWWAWDVDGSVWLLPAYRFIGDDGGWYTVPAVTDEFMIQVEPPVGVPEPMPAPEPVEPGQDPDEGMATGGGEPATDPAVPEPAPAADPAQLDELLGLTIDEFSAEAGAMGYDTRVVAEDGEAYAVTDDYSETRVNVAVEVGVVVAIEFIG